MMMRIFILIFVASILFSPMGNIPRAQDSLALASVPDGAQCFNVYNKSKYGIRGSFYTDYYPNKDGIKGRNQSNFRLKSYEKAEFCSYGPFYGQDDNQLYLVLRTIVPVFYCYIKAEGDIVINGIRKPEGGMQIWSEACVDKTLENLQ